MLKFCCIIILFLFLSKVFCCNIETLLQGTFQRQFNQITDNSLSPVHFEKIIITSSSANVWGDCYEKVESHSFIFGLKRTGKGTCFRCITLIPRSPNVIQSLHQDSETCHEAVMDAKRSCFDPSAIGPGDGELLFRVENILYQSCGLEGNFDVEYGRVNQKELKCDIDSGTQMQNCDSKEELHFEFRNCSFPSFDQKIICLGSWPSVKNEHFLALFDQDTRKYRCGKLNSYKNETKLLLSADAYCSKIEANTAFESYKFIEKNRKQNFASCEFPEWLQGEYDGLSVKVDQIRHRLSNSPPLVSTCVEVDNERILVHSETSCGESIGYHCLWFKSRSNSIIEFKTTTIANEGNGMCKRENEFNQAVWTTLISKTPKKSACAYFGSYSTPKEMQINDCYNLTVNCKKRNQFKIIAYHCQSGNAYDVKSYDCYGTWKEGDNLFVYAKTQDSQNDNVCMISRQQGEYLYIAILGNHCNRNFNFSENPDSVLVLKRTEDCSSQIPSTQTPNEHSLLMISSTPNTRRLSPPRRIETNELDVNYPFIWNQNYTSSSPNILEVNNFIISGLIFLTFFNF